MAIRSWSGTDLFYGVDSTFRSRILTKIDTRHCPVSIFVSILDWKVYSSGFKPFYNFSKLLFDSVGRVFCTEFSCKITNFKTQMPNREITSRLDLKTFILLCVFLQNVHVNCQLQKHWLLTFQNCIIASYKVFLLYEVPKKLGKVISNRFCINSGTMITFYDINIQ